MNFRQKILLCGAMTCCALIGLASHANAASELDDTRSTFIEWTKVKSQISKETSEWKEEKTLLKDMISASESELEMIEKRIVELEQSSTQTDEKKSELSESIAKAKDTASMLEATTAKQEEKARKIVATLPDPLLMDIQPLIQRLPTDEEAAKKMSLSQRVQTVVGILTQVEKFHSQISLVSEIKEVSPGHSKEVKTIYFGLSTAYYADANAQNAGYGYPTEDGWNWAPVSGEPAQRIATAIAIHSNDAPPAFVSLPVEIK